MDSQRANRRHLVMELDVGVDAQRQPNAAVPGRRLGHLGRNVGTLQAGDERMAGAVEICIQAVVAVVAKEIRALPDHLLTGRPGLGGVLSGPSDR